MLRLLLVLLLMLLLMLLMLLLLLIRMLLLLLGVAVVVVVQELYPLIFGVEQREYHRLGPENYARVAGWVLQGMFIVYGTAPKRQSEEGEWVLAAVDMGV